MTDASDLLRIAGNVGSAYEIGERLQNQVEMHAGYSKEDKDVIERTLMDAAARAQCSPVTNTVALPARPRKPPCPNCGTKLQIKCLADDWGEIFGKWRYCEYCCWDERSNCSRHPQRLLPAEMTDGDSGTPENGAAE